MGCEYSDKIRSGRTPQDLVIEIFEQLTEHDKKMFHVHYGIPSPAMDDEEAARAYHHCKRVIKTYTHKHRIVRVG